MNFELSRAEHTYVPAHAHFIRVKILFEQKQVKEPDLDHVVTTPNLNYLDYLKGRGAHKVII